jgi:hypothetical protein
MTFISFAIGTIINVIYAALSNSLLVTILHITTYYLFCFSFIFLLLFNLIILRSSEIINRRKQFLLIGIWALILAGLYIIGLLGGVTINESTNWKGVWNLGFFLYGIISCYGFTIIPTLYYSIEIYNSFDMDVLKKRWKFYIMGLTIFYFLFTGTSLSNLIQSDIFNLVWGIVSLIAFLGVYFLYYGVGKQLQT